MKNKLTQALTISLSTLFVFAATQKIQAEVIEHTADRYIVNVDEMELAGNESVMDILLMCPDVLTTDATSAIDYNMYGNFVVRVDNIDIYVNAKGFLSNTKARDVKRIQICQNPGVLKGCENLEQVIDINMRQDSEGTSARVSISGDSETTISSYNSFFSQSEKIKFYGIAEGNVYTDKFPKRDYYSNHHDGLRANLKYQPTERDYFMFDLKQAFDCDKVGSSEIDMHCLRLDATYILSSSDKQSMFLVYVSSDFNTNKIADNKSYVTNPYGYIELNMPLANNKLYLTAGLEGGFHTQRNNANDSKDNSDYEDIYAQINWKLGKWTLSVGDRFRFKKYKYEYEHILPTLENRARHNFFTTTAFFKPNERHTLQGTFARQFITGEPQYSAITNKYNLADDRNVLISEIRHSFFTSRTTFTSVLKNIYQDLRDGHGQDNTFMVGTSVFTHLGVLRLVAGLNVFLQENTATAGNTENQFAQLRFSPQLNLNKGWRLAATLVYNTDKSSLLADPYINGVFNENLLDPAKTHAALQIEKTFFDKLLVEVKFYDDITGDESDRNIAGKITYQF